MRVPANAELLRRVIYRDNDTGDTVTIKLKQSSIARRNPLIWVEQVQHNADGHLTGLAGHQYPADRHTDGETKFNQLAAAAHAAGLREFGRYPYTPTH